MTEQSDLLGEAGDGMAIAENPLVSTIVANWNGARHLEICLPSLLSQSYKPLEIIVVDNASTDDSANVVRNFDVRWLRIESNIGLAPALNRGAQIAAGELLLFLNNDMRFHQEFVRVAVHELTRDPKIFAIDALQYDWEGKNQVHLATRLTKRPTRKDSDVQLVPGLYVRQETRDGPTTVLMASAANMLARRCMFQVLRGFDERLPAGYEDVDLCWRAWVRGWKTLFVPTAVCWHRVGSASRSTEGARVRFRGTLGGRLLVATKLFPLKYTTLTWVATLSGLAKDLVRLRWQRTSDRGRVLSEYVRYLPGLIRERQKIYKPAGTTTNQQLEQLLRL